MQPTQAIIVYRNPAEAALWEALSNGQFFPIIVGIVVFFITFMIANHLICGGRNWRVPQWKINTALAIGAAAGVFTVWGMWL